MNKKLMTDTAELIENMLEDIGQYMAGIKCKTDYYRYEEAEETVKRLLKAVSKGGRAKSRA